MVLCVPIREGFKVDSPFLCYIISKCHDNNNYIIQLKVIMVMYYKESRAVIFLQCLPSHIGKV